MKSPISRISGEYLLAWERTHSERPRRYGRPRTRVFLQRRYCWESVLELHHEPLWVMEDKYS